MGTTRRDAAWHALEAHHREVGDLDLREVFARHDHRVARLSFEACGLVVDLSRHRILPRTLDLLVALAQACDLPARRSLLFEGGVVNETEGRAAMHTALRARADRPLLVDGKDVRAEVRTVFGRMRALAQAVRDGSWRGFTGRAVRDVVNLASGGSDLGPALAATALDAWRAPHLEGHYVSNLDGAHLDGVLSRLDPETTLFVVASTTFATPETLANARSARRWLVEALGNEAAVARHFVAASAHPERARAFGIDPAATIPSWDWVGERHSLWSSLGLSVAILVGMDAFEALLAGAAAMDEHFETARLAANLPVLLGLLGVWCTDVLGASSHAVLPYDWALRLLPAHLQHLEMGSTGKCVRRDGSPVTSATCPVVWGGPGSSGQHAVYQLLHQGARWVPADILVAAESQAPLPGHQDAVLANALGQAEALMRGRTAQEARREMTAEGLAPERVEALTPHKVTPGNRPTTTILYRRLTPALLGSLVALYEHKVFVQSVIWDVNPFDTWGLELGQRLAGRILSDLTAPQPTRGHDPATAALLARIRAWRSGA